MQKNVIIGIGGTGARVIESAIHLCAAGLGPSELNIIIIDPDEANGNLTHTKSLIKEYVELRKKFKNKGDNTLFKTNIVISPSGKFVWNIFQEKDSTLGKYMNYDNLKKNNQTLSDFAEILFTEKELNTGLNEGFRGHPSIGAVVMADPPMDEYPFKLLWDDISTLSANDLRVFIVGSIFGGTGAAGFPTIGSRPLIKFNEKFNATLGGGKSRVLLGGALVLPYFSFSTDSEVDEPMFVTTNDFPIATKAALQYYNDKELGFDQYYFIGDSLAQKVGNFSTGSATQDNYPHYIEMVSAIASFDFFNQPKIDDIPDKKYFIACREMESVDWSMLPLTRDNDKLQEERDRFKQKVSDFTIFAYTYLAYGKGIIAQKHQDVLAEAWYSENFKKNFKESDVQANPRYGENTDLFEVAENYFKDFLFWICSIDKNENAHLIDSNNLLEGDLDIKDRKEIKLKDPTKFKSNIGQIIVERNSGLNFDAFKTRCLQETIIDDKTMYAGNRFLNIFYEASKKFNKINRVIK